MSALERNPQVPALSSHKVLGPGISGRGIPKGPRGTPTIQFVLDDRIITTQKCALFCVPRGVCHAPIIVPELHRKLFHFSGSNAETYVRT